MLVSELCFHGNQNFVLILHVFITNYVSSTILYIAYGNQIHLGCIGSQKPIVFIYSLSLVLYRPEMESVCACANQKCRGGSISDTASYGHLHLSWKFHACIHKRTILSLSRLTSVRYKRVRRCHYNMFWWFQSYHGHADDFK